MITGTVNARYKMVVKLPVRSSTGQVQEVVAVLDSGFTGSLNSPDSDAEPAVGPKQREGQMRRRCELGVLEACMMTAASSLAMAGLLAGTLYVVGIGCAYNGWSLIYAILLANLYFIMQVLKPRREQPASLGCLLLLAALLVAFVLYGAAVAGFVPDLLLDHARVLFGLAVVLCPVWIAWMMLEAYYYQVWLRPMLERDLGFRYGKYLQQITMEAIQPGGLFDRAGFRPWDVIANNVSITEFFRQLENARGKEQITITVAPWSAKIKLKDRPKRTLSVLVPAKDEASRNREPVP